MRNPEKETANPPTNSLDIPDRSSSGGWRVWLGVAISLGAVVVLLRGVNLTQVTTTLKQVNFVWLTLGVISVAATLIAKGARWRVLFSADRKPSMRRAFHVLMIGMMVNSFAPARMGELVRAYMIGSSEGRSKVYTLSTIALEKITDLVFLVLCVLLLITRMSLPSWLLEPYRVTAVVLAVILPVLVVLVWQKDRFFRLLGGFNKRFFSLIWEDWLVQRARAGIAGLGAIQNPRMLIGLILTSIFVWLLAASTNLLIFNAMGLPLPTEAGLLLLVVLQAGIAVPSSLGRIGVFHYLTVISLGVFAVSRETALGTGIVLHLVVYLPMILLGGWSLWQERASWKSLSEQFSRTRQLRKA